MMDQDKYFKRWWLDDCVVCSISTTSTNRQLSGKQAQQQGDTNRIQSVLSDLKHTYAANNY